MSNRDGTRGSKGPLLLPVILVVVGVLLLLNNFFLLGGFNLINLSPVLLVIAGAIVLLRGDLFSSDDYRTFGITRGSIESATLEINSGEIDVSIRALQTRNTERLIAGQYASQARPDLDVRDVHAHLQMQRSQTPLLSSADWEMGLSQDLPWQIVTSSYLGQIEVDLSRVIMQNALITTGIGDIHLIAPAEAFEPIYVRSVFGNINVITPEDYNVRVAIEGGHFFGVIVDELRYEEIETGVYASRDIDETLPLVDIIIRGTFGDAYLS